MNTWLEEIEAEFEAIETELVEGESLGGDFPLWVKNIALCLVHASFPKLGLRKGEGKLEPRKVGMLIGYKLLYARFSKEMAAHPDPRLQEIYGSLNVVYSNVVGAVKRALATAVEAPFEEGAEFVSGFGHVFQKPKNAAPKALTKKQITLQRTYAVYMYLLMNWQDVPVFITSTELFRWLDERLSPEVMGKNPYWISGICTRIGFPLARVGPPKKSRRR